MSYPQFVDVCSGAILAATLENVHVLSVGRHRSVWVPSVQIKPFDYKKGLYVNARISQTALSS